MNAHTRKTAGGLLLLSALLLGAVSCHKPERAYPAGIDFEASTVPDEPGTKLGYLGESGTETMPNSGKVLLHWAKDDKIRIAGANAVRSGDETLHWQDYGVSSVSYVAGSPECRAKIAVLDPANPLKWLDTSAGASAMYAVYPSPLQLDGKLDAALLESLVLDGSAGSFTGYIPGRQELTRRSDDASSAAYNIYDAPMDFAYLGARQSCLPFEQVRFLFLPAFTAFEFTVTPSESFPAPQIDSVRLYSSGMTLAGGFSCDLGGDVPAVTRSGNGEAVVVDFTAFGPDGVTAGSDKPVVFTVLALGCEHSSVTIQFYGPQIGRRSLTFRSSSTGEVLSFAGRRRYRFGSLSFPSTLGVAYGEEIDWNGMLNDGEDLDWDGSDLNSGEKITWGN